MSVENSLYGKRVLFIAPMFFGYEKLIKEELERKGAIVDYFNDRPGNDFWTKALIRVNRFLLAHKTNSYYKSIIESTSKNSYDHVLIVRGEAISPKMLSLLRQAQPKARLSLYLWDSMRYNPNAKKLLDGFDKVYSFDRSDVDSYPKIQFLPLFYAHEFESAADWDGDTTYDACFIGTIHTDRYKVLEKIIDDLRSKGRKVFVFCYYPSKRLYFLRALINPGFYRFGKRYISFEGMKLKELVANIAKSKAIIDINRPGQLGLTMRTIEAVGSRRRLITTNYDIINYDLYGSGAVMVVDRENPDIPESFFAGNVKAFDLPLREKYSVSTWVDRLFTHD